MPKKSKKEKWEYPLRNREVGWAIHTHKLEKKQEPVFRLSRPSARPFPKKAVDKVLQKYYLESAIGRVKRQMCTADIYKEDSP